MSSRTDIAIVGHTTHDRYERGFVAGGCAFYGARVYRELLAEPVDQFHLATLVGEDFVCEDALEGLPHSLVRRGRTTTFQNLYPEGRPRLQIIEAQAPEVLPSMFDRALFAGTGVLHLAPVLREIDLPTWLAFVDAMAPADRPDWLAISVQGWIKRGGPLVDRDSAALADLGGLSEVPGTAREVVQEPWEVSRDTLRGVDIACLSDEDLIGQGDLLDRLVDAVSIVALTHGEEGATVFVDGAEHARVGVYQQADVVDPTGAGDTFAGGFIYALTRQGRDPEDAARFGAACASIVVEGTGGACLERLGEAEERAARVG